MTSQKLNDHTLHERESIVIGDDSNWYRETCICQTFNFIARQRTISTEIVLWDKAVKQHSIGVSMVTENFRDIEGQEEIARAHAELRRLGGNPPPLDDVLDRKGARLRATP